MDLATVAQAVPDRAALIEGDQPYTFEFLARASGEAGARLAELGVRAGDPVLIEGGYDVPTLAYLFALMRLGAVIAPLTPLGDEQRARRGRLIAARWWLQPQGGRFEALAGVELPPLLARLRDEGEAGLVLFSSGSTAEPKAIVHAVGHLLPEVEVARRPLRMAILLLFDHIGGLNTLLHGLSHGHTLVVPSSLEPTAVAEALERHQVQVLPASPTFLNLLLLSGELERRDLSHLRLVTYGTEPMPPALLSRLRAVLPKTKFLQTFGTSETGIHTTRSRDSDSNWMRIEDPRVETRLVEGELWLRGPHLMRGYLNAASRMTDDGWFRTGDLVEMGSDGYYRIVGRLAEVINVGGQKCVPGEVESVLLELPEVAAVRCLAVPHPLLGQTVAVEVVPTAGLAAEEVRRVVRAHARRRLEAFKVPTRIDLRESLAVGARLKTQRINHGQG